MPPVVDEIKIFDNDDQAKNITVVCHYMNNWQTTVMFYGLVIVIKNFNFINGRNLRQPF